MNLDCLAQCADLQIPQGEKPWGGQGLDQDKTARVKFTDTEQRIGMLRASDGMKLIVVAGVGLGIIVPC